MKQGRVALLSVVLGCSVIANDAIQLRIINGKEVAQQSEKWEWILSLRQYGEHICGASLIAPNWAVTAAHCISIEEGVVPASLLTVMSGSYNIYSRANIVKVEEVVRHPAYNEYSVNNDIALLKLSSSITNIAPITVDQNTPLTKGEVSYVAGWGNMSVTGTEFPDRLMEVDLPIIDFDACSRSYRREGIELTYNMFCAGYMDGSKDSCQGDSGGPLIVPHNQDFVLAGIVSFGGSEEQMCGAAEYPGIYTKVQNYVAWIERYTGPLSRKSTLEDILEEHEVYTIDGTFGEYDFENVPSYFDWVYQAADGRIFQLQGKQPSDHDVFGWREVTNVTLQPKWKMFALGSDVDGDGTTKFDWVLVGVHTDAVYKLKGVTPKGTFEYSDKINIRYIVREDKVYFYR